MRIRTDTYQQQSDLAKYCRTNILADSLRVRKDRVHHYRRLVYNVVDESLIAAYPLLNNLLSEIEWDGMVTDFFATFACQSTQIWKMPGEFYKYIESTDLALKVIYPHLVDLIYFEWIEVEMFMMEDLEYPSFETNGDWLNDKIAVNPEHKIIQLNFPVHIKKAQSIADTDRDEYFLLVYREKETGKVQFTDISAMFALLIENIVKGMTLNEILMELKPILKFENTDQLTDKIFPFLESLKKKGLLIGFMK